VVEDLVQETYTKLRENGCRLLRDFAIEHPEAEAILGYVKVVAANVTHDHFKHIRSQKSGGDERHVSTSKVDPEARNDVNGLLHQVDEHLKRGLTGPDAERDRMIFWLYFRLGMSCKEIACLPSIGLGAKGVGSVIERLKRCLREQHLQRQSSGGDQPHVSTIDIDPEAGQEVHGSQERIAFEVLLNEIDEHLKHCLTLRRSHDRLPQALTSEPDQERDRMIFWLYFRLGMSSREIACLPSIGLGANGVGSVIERLKRCLREQILRSRADSEDDKE